MFRALLQKLYPKDSVYQIERKMAGFFFGFIGVLVLIVTVAFIMMGGPGLKWKGTIRTGNTPTLTR